MVKLNKDRSENFLAFVSRLLGLDPAPGLYSNGPSIYNSLVYYNFEIIY